jgi:hypothetical protein
MRRNRLHVAGRWLAATLLLAAGTASAQEQVTVQTLLDEGFSVVESFFNPNVGVGLFLQRENRLFFCVVRETADNTPLTTLYCKPVG